MDCLENSCEKSLGKFTVSLSGIDGTYRIKLSSSNKLIISRSALALFFYYKGWNDPISDHLITRFCDKFLEEVPPANLVFPLSIVEDWYSRNKALMKKTLANTASH